MCHQNAQVSPRKRRIHLTVSARLSQPKAEVAKWNFWKIFRSLVATYGRNSKPKIFWFLTVMGQGIRGQRFRGPKIGENRIWLSWKILLLDQKKFFYAFLWGTIRRLNKKKFFEILISKIFQEGQISGFLDPTLKNHNKKVHHRNFF